MLRRRRRRNVRSYAVRNVQSFAVGHGSVGRWSDASLVGCVVGLEVDGLERVDVADDGLVVDEGLVRALVLISWRGEWRRGWKVFDVAFDNCST